MTSTTSSSSIPSSSTSSEVFHNSSLYILKAVLIRCLRNSNLMIQYHYRRHTNGQTFSRNIQFQQLVIIMTKFFETKPITTIFHANNNAHKEFNALVTGRSLSFTPYALRLLLTSILNTSSDTTKLSIVSLLRTLKTKTTIQEPIPNTMWCSCAQCCFDTDNFGKSVLYKTYCRHQRNANDNNNSVPNVNHSYNDDDFGSSINDDESSYHHDVPPSPSPPPSPPPPPPPPPPFIPVPLRWSSGDLYPPDLQSEDNNLERCMASLIHLQLIAHPSTTAACIQAVLDWCSNSLKVLKVDMFAFLLTYKYRRMLAINIAGYDKKQDPTVVRYDVCPKGCTIYSGSVCKENDAELECTEPLNCKIHATVCAAAGCNTLRYVYNTVPASTMAVFSLTKQLRARFRISVYAKAYVSSFSKEYARDDKYIHSIHQGEMTISIDTAMKQTILANPARFEGKVVHRLQGVLSCDGVSVNLNEGTKKSLHPFLLQITNLPESMNANHNMLHLLGIPPVNTSEKTVTKCFGKTQKKISSILTC